MSDPLSDILLLLRPQREGSGAVDFGGDWHVRVPAYRGLRCYAVGRGACWIEVEGGGGPVQLRDDDCLLLAGGAPFHFGSAPHPLATEPSDPDLFARDQVSAVNGGGACVLVGGHFSLAAAYDQLLSSALPPLTVVRDRGGREALGRALEGLWRELEHPQPGGRLVLEHLTQMMLIFALRLCAGSGAQAPPGWLSALADPRISKAMAAIHAAPQQAWTLQSLAVEAGMSRTSFSERFKVVMGVAPIAYLHAWRMVIAADRLRRADASVGHVAMAVGYGSGTAFSTAFRKAFGVAPKDYAHS